MAKRMIVCSLCKRTKKHHAKGMCRSCHNTYRRPFRIIVCERCGEEKVHYARKLCAKCYRIVNPYSETANRSFGTGGRPPACIKCGRSEEVSHHAHGMCITCSAGQRPCAECKRVKRIKRAGLCSACDKRKMRRLKKAT